LSKLKPLFGAPQKGEWANSGGFAATSALRRPLRFRISADVSGMGAGDVCRQWVPAMRTGGGHGRRW
jgi:hypothetical protein